MLKTERKKCFKTCIEIKIATAKNGFGWLNIMLHILRIFFKLLRSKIETSNNEMEVNYNIKRNPLLLSANFVHNSCISTCVNIFSRLHIEKVLYQLLTHFCQLFQSYPSQSSGMFLASHKHIATILQTR